MRLKLILLILLISSSFAAQEYQLSKPLIKMEDGCFFDKKTSVHLDFRLEGATLYYTLDGSEPTKQSHLYKKPLSIKKNCIVKVKAFKEGFKPSETVLAQLQKLGLRIHDIIVSPEPSEAYAGDGDATLINRKAGSMNFRDGQWLGYNKGTVTLTLDLGKKQKLKEIMVSSLSSAGAWIMPPASIEFMTSIDGAHFDKIDQLNIPTPKQTDSAGKAYYSTELSGITCQYLRLVIEPLGSLPDWHPGKGTPGWLFLDEIIIR